MQKLKLTCLILASLMLTTCANQVPERLGSPVAAEIASVRGSSLSAASGSESVDEALLREKTEDFAYPEIPEVTETPVPTGIAGFLDVWEGDSFAEAVSWAAAEGLISAEEGSYFGPNEVMTRGEAARLLWKVFGSQPPLYGADSADEQQLAIGWGAERRIFSGTEDGFAPESPCTHAQLLTFLWRSKGYASAESPWYGAAWSWAARYGLLPAENSPEPDQPCTRGEGISYFYRFWSMDGSYDYAQPVPACEPVSPEWFDDAVFIGDSVTVRLNMYAYATGALSNAGFLAETSRCAGSCCVEDDVAAMGAKNVYIMLGINDMAYDFEKVVHNMEKLVDRIRAKSPDVNILIESVTPMTRESGRADEQLNNTIIEEYNRRMQALCAEYGWYYVDVASACRDGDGYLPEELCGDAKQMGIHFNTEGARVWVDYLLTHVPEPLRAN